ERILYQQNFETATDAAATGWSYGVEGGMTIASDEYGKYLQLSLGQNNGRSGQVTWGQEIFQDSEGNLIIDGDTYDLAFDFCIQAMPTDQLNSEITVFTNHAPIANNLYRLPWSDAKKNQKEHHNGVWDNFLFDLSQCNPAKGDADMLAAINAPLIKTEVEDSTAYGYTKYTLDTSEPYSLSTGMWYTVTMNVNIKTRKVEYSVIDLTGNELTSGDMTVPEVDLNGEAISMFAEGIYVLMARYQSVFLFDNIKVSYYSDGDWANTPTIALTRLGQNEDGELDLNLRAYTITFLDGETLHVKGTNGEEIETEFADCDGAYVYETTKSGKLEAWTTCGTATSDVASTEVECVPEPLPEVVATITSVEVGFGKTYTLTISNANVPLQPTIFINYEFIGTNGEKLSAKGEASGVKVTVPGEGTLKLTSQAFGYQETNSSVENNLEFAVKKQWDFARMTDEQIKAAGFPADYQVLNSGTTDGFQNWTARKRLFYYDVATAAESETGETVYASVFPFGFTNSEEQVLYYTELDVEGEVATNVAGHELFEGITVYAGHNVTYLKHIGMINNSTKGGNNKNIDVLDLDKTDFVVINRINNYGGNSNHPVCADDDAYYAQLAGDSEVYSVAASGVLNEETGKYTVSCPVYRIDTAATCVTAFAQVGGPIEDAVEAVEAAAVVDNNWYTISGVRVAEPTQPGLYIHNGKKYIVK
ncbi:MAG: hypothetical protein K2H49_05000, partial [Muribaculaceae bacterium]|nr:hypothetical protein [Muribaculaceae bacterium]